MIRYDLICPCGHDFDSWFRDSAAFEKARKAGAVTCPVCGRAEVEKALMAPAVSGTKKDRPAAEPIKVAAADPRQTQFREFLRAVRKHVTENAENVGSRFAEEARKIHYREAEARGIYGEATPDEARALVEEGIEFQALPTLPEEQN